MNCTGISSHLKLSTTLLSSQSLFKQRGRSGTHRFRRLFVSTLLLAAFGGDTGEVSSGTATSDLRLPVQHPSFRRRRKFSRHMEVRWHSSGPVGGVVVGWCRVHERCWYL